MDIKRRMAAGLLCAAGALLFAACGGESGSPQEGEGVAATEDAGAAASAGAADNGKVTLKVWAEEPNFEMLGQMIDAFEQEHAGEADFDIQLEAAADSDTKNHLLDDIHNGADVFPMADDQLNAIVAAGGLAPVPNADEVRAANLEEAVDAASVNGTLYAYPMTADNGYFLFYDKRYFTDEDVKTMDGILAVCEAEGKQMTMDWTSGWYLYSFFGNTGLDFGLNEDGVTNHCGWNSADGPIKGTDVAQAMLDISASPGFKSAGDADFVAGIKDGSVIAGVSGVWSTMDVIDAWGEDYGAVKLPTYTVAGQQVQMSSFVGYKMLGVNAYSEHVEWALELADWLTNEQNQVIRFEQRSQGPSNKNAAASDAIDNVPSITAVLDQAQYGVLQRVGNNYWDPMTSFGNAMAAGNPSGMGLQELMDALVEGITASTAQ